MNFFLTMTVSVTSKIFPLSLESPCIYHCYTVTCVLLINVNRAMGAAGSYETSEHIYQITWRHTLLDFRLSRWQREALRSDTTRASNEEVRALLHRTNTCMSAWLLTEWRPAGRSELFLFCP